MRKYCDFTIEKTHFHWKPWKILRKFYKKRDNKRFWSYNDTEFHAVRPYVIQVKTNLNEIYLFTKQMIALHNLRQILASSSSTNVKYHSFWNLRKFTVIWYKYLAFIQTSVEFNNLLFYKSRDLFIFFSLVFGST